MRVSRIRKLFETLSLDTVECHKYGTAPICVANLLITSADHGICRTASEIPGYCAE